MPQCSVDLFSDGDGIGQAGLFAAGIDEAAIDPIIDDPHADAVLVAELTHVEGSGGDRRTWDAVLVPDPADHAEGKGLAGRTRPVLVSQQCDDLLIVLLAPQSSDAANERVGIADSFRPVRR